MVIAQALLAAVISIGQTQYNDTNYPPPLPSPTVEQVVGLRRLNRLYRHLDSHHNATVESFVRRELSLPHNERISIRRLAQHFAIPEVDARSLFHGPGGQAGVARRVHIYVHWWDRYSNFRQDPSSV